MQKKKINNKSTVINPVNKDIMNLIQPSGVSFSKTGLVLSENYGKVMVINRFDTTPQYGWLAKLMNMKGCICKTHCVPTDSSILIERCNADIKRLNREIDSTINESERQSKEKAVDTTRKLISKISGSEGEGIVYCTVLVFIQAYSEELLVERTKDVMAVVAQQNCAIRNLTMYQEEGFLSVSPYNMVDVSIMDIGERNMPLSTLWGGFPNAESGINDGRGWLIGKTPSGEINLLDMWKRGQDRINSNMLVTGMPGSGKSTAVKSHEIEEWATGSKVFIFDPSPEYHDIVKAEDGDILDCSRGGVRINPFQVRKLPEDDREDEVKVYVDTGKGIGQLAMHFQFLRSFFKLYKKEMSDLEMDTLEIAWENIYKARGITWETDCSKLKPEDYPIAEEMYHELERMYKENPKDKELERLLKRMRSISIGADSNLWNGYTNIEINSDVVDFDISGLKDADVGIQGAQYYNLLTWVMEKVTADRTQRVDVYVDEAYLMLDPEIPLPMLCLRNYAKQFRKFEGALIIITHAVADLLDPAVKRHGQAIIDAACYKLIMGTTGQNFEETRKLFQFTQEEEEIITSMQRGMGVLIAGATKVITEVVVKKEFLKMMGDAGGR